MKVLKTAPLFALALVTAVTSLPSYAEISCGTNSYKVNVCEGSVGQFGKNKQWQLEAGSYSVGGQTDDRQCLVTTIKADKVRPGTSVNFYVLTKNGAQNSGSDTIPNCGFGSGAGNGGGGQQPTQPTQPTQPVIKRADYNKLINTADQQARCFANLVVESYAAAESYRYNIRQGMLQAVGARRFSDLLNGSVALSNHEYALGLQSGMNEGARKGELQGMAKGQADGAAQGSADATGRFTAVVGTGQAADTSFRIPTVNVPTFRADINSAHSLDAHLRAQQNRVDSIMTGLQFNLDGQLIGYNTFGEYFGQSSLLSDNYSYDTLRSYYRSDWALKHFMYQTLGRRCDQGVRYYNNTLEHQDDRMIFSNQFKSTYNNVIDSKWANAVTATNPQALVLGQQLGREAYSNYAKELGFVDGYVQTYSSAASAPYVSSFAHGYAQSFQNRVGTLQTSALVSGVEVRLVAPAGGFYVGGPLIAVVSKGINIGQKASSEGAIVSGTGLVATGNRLEIAGSSVVTSEISLVVATLNSDLKADTAYRANVQIAGATASTDALKIDWVKQVERFAKMSQDDALYAQTREWMMQTLNVEYNRTIGGFASRIYVTPGVDSQLEQMIEVYNAQDAQGKANLAAARDYLKRAIGVQPKKGFFGGSGKINAWKAVGAIYDRMK